MSPVNFVESEELEIDFEKDVLPEELAFIWRTIYDIVPVFDTLQDFTPQGHKP